MAGQRLALTPAPGKPRQELKLAADKCFLLVTSPTFDPALRHDRILDALKVLTEHEFHGTTPCGVAVKNAGLMLREASVQSKPRGPDVYEPSAQRRM